MLKSRITKIEAKLQPHADRPLLQVLQPGGGAQVRYSSGQFVTVNQPLPGVKSYEGFSPDIWDEVINGE
jgi:hypothetical protein